ncbi:MAG: nucleoside monophosphate kinase [Candidatus Pacebacteria bacterium]|nr:nucleoside monophosphate kinase [Candidatus Paceibacterota bacterium]MBP9818699.1 nucleoside monophosphate kinase [Candidatus Paceibacterota bacterium]
MPSTLQPKTFIFIGRSGCGKGTQAKILREHLEKMDPNKRKIMYLETGPRFREFIKLPGYTNKLAAHVADIGGRQPDFLAVWNWSHVLIEEMTGEEHLIVDGMPRSYDEALVFDSAISFYKRTKPTVIYIDVGPEWSRKHLFTRSKIEGRKDDASLELIQRRLNWFDTDVMPALKYFETNPGYDFVHVSGEQTIDQVTQAILKGLSW